MTHVMDVEPWTAAAICGDAPNPDLWFSDDVADIRAAVEVCGNCPVRVECAVRGAAEPFGVWGGVPDAEQARKLGVPGRRVSIPGVGPSGRRSSSAAADVEAARALILSLLSSGASLERVAAELGCTVDGVARRISRARSAGWVFPDVVGGSAPSPRSIRADREAS